MFVAHFDIDAFYASVAVRDNPQLQGRPVAVAGNHRRSVVLTASYEARVFGVRSAIPLYRALEMCADLIVVPPDMAKYTSISRDVFAVYSRRGHAVEGLSLDEAFVDLADVTCDRAAQIAASIRSEVREATGLTISGGVATGKSVAKIASDSCKPDGLLVIAPSEEAAFLSPMPVARLWGVGPKTAARLHTLGIHTIGDVASLDDSRAKEFFGSSGFEMRDLARGIDCRTVQADRETKSISTEETFEYDLCDERRLIDVLREQARELATKLEREGCAASTVGVKIKRADFRVFGRQTHLHEPTRDARRIFRAALHCLQRAELRGTPVRLLGVRVASLTAGTPRQISLFAAPK
ncbi:MAG: DNA polymerase IV [Candidatus Eremiobacteraeota bacterium]|nr:DNA polymerase IV [Candidatus Eremiobacteraeota bacterium]